MGRCTRWILNLPIQGFIIWVVFLGLVSKYNLSDLLHIFSKPTQEVYIFTKTKSILHEPNIIAVSEVLYCFYQAAQFTLISLFINFSDLCICLEEKDFACLSLNLRNVEDK